MLCGLYKKYCNPLKLLVNRVDYWSQYSRILAPGICLRSKTKAQIRINSYREFLKQSARVVWCIHTVVVVTILHSGTRCQVEGVSPLPVNTYIRDRSSFCLLGVCLNIWRHTLRLDRADKDSNIISLFDVWWALKKCTVWFGIIYRQIYSNPIVSYKCAPHLFQNGVMGYRFKWFTHS